MPEGSNTDKANGFTVAQLSLYYFFFFGRFFLLVAANSSS
jgi:hypothetical protein